MSPDNHERSGNTIFSVVELEHECDGEKRLFDEHLFSSRDGGLRFLRRQYEEVKRWATAGSGVFSDDYSDDGWFQVVDADGYMREGYLSSGMQINSGSEENIR